ncbi:hypothetical protein Tco_1285635 [Tanacetum coccineum]
MQLKSLKELTYSRINKNKDLHDHLIVFYAATEQEEWHMPVWCKMFHQILGVVTRNWFDDLDPKSVDVFAHVSQKFLEDFSQQKGMPRIRRRSMGSRGSQMKGYKHLWIVSRLRVCTSKEYLRNRNNQWSLGTCASYVKKDGYTPLTKTPKEILDMDKVNFPHSSHLLHTSQGSFLGGGGFGGTIVVSLIVTLWQACTMVLAKECYWSLVAFWQGRSEPQLPLATYVRNFGLCVLHVVPLLSLMIFCADVIILSRCCGLCCWFGVGLPSSISVLHLPTECNRRKLAGAALLTELYGFFGSSNLTVDPDAVSMIQTASYLSPDAIENIQTASPKPGLESSSIFIPVSYLLANNLPRSLIFEELSLISDLSYEMLVMELASAGMRPQTPSRTRMAGEGCAFDQWSMMSSSNFRFHLILKKFDFDSVKTANTPIESQKPLIKDEEAADVDVHLYRSMIGSLMYLTASRPDIMYAVCACSSDYAGANLDRKSTTGGCQFLGRRLISWQCKKQTIVATSTTEAEFNFLNLLNIGMITIAAEFRGRPKWQAKTLYCQANLSTVKLPLEPREIGMQSVKLMKLEAMVEERRIFKCWFHYHTTNGHQFTMFNRHQELASPEQTNSGKDFSNPLMADSLPKKNSLWFLTHQLYTLAIPEQTDTGKETSNPFMAVLEDHEKVNQVLHLGVSQLAEKSTKELIENNLKPCIAATIIEDHDAFRSEVPDLVSQEFNAQAPKIIEELC